MMLGKNLGVDETVPRIPLGSVGVEIGVWRGDSSTKFLTRARYLHLVDPWSAAAYEQGGEFTDYASYLAYYSAQVGSADPRRFEAFYDEVFHGVVRRFHNKPVTVHRCTSAEFFAAFKERVDWVYIDGQHGFVGCLQDLRGAKRIIRPGGCIFGDDYGMPNHRRLGGVTAAVDAFIAECDLPLRLLGRHQYAIQL